MASGINLPTLSQGVQNYLAAMSSRLNQALPQMPQAFVNVLAVAEASGDYVVAKLVIDRFLARFVQTAQGSDLDFLGSEYGVARQLATPATVTASLTATDGIVVPISTLFNGANGLSYQTTAGLTAPNPGGAGTGLVLTLQAILPQAQGGAASNLANGATLNIASAIAGAGLTATVTGTTVTGTDPEIDSAYRARLLAYIQSTPTGSNLASYRLWGYAVAGIVGVYPYSGPPSGTPYPGQRTIYVECATSINADGIPGGSWTPSTLTAAGLVGQVATAIRFNPVTGAANEETGLVPGQLYVLPITRTPMYVQITGLSVPGGLASACQADILTAVTAYFLSIRPYIQGLDPSTTQALSMATQVGLSSVIYAVLLTYGATLQNVAFGTVFGTWTPVYAVGMGEKTKLASITYV